MSDSGAPASTSAAETASVRGVAFGWAKVAVSMTMPPIERGRERPVPERERLAEAGRQQRDHLARGGRRRVDPVGGGGDGVGGVVVDDDARQALEQRGVAVAHVPDPIERPAVGDDEQVVARRPGPGRCESARCRSRKS